MTITDPIDRLHDDLEAISSAAGAELSRSRTRRLMVRALDDSFLLILLVPVIALLLALFGAVFGLAVPKLPLWVQILITLFVPGLFLLGKRVAASMNLDQDLLPLAVVDRELDLEDRLQTAAEFLRLDERTPFMQAAVIDAVPFAERARTFELACDRPPYAVRGRSWMIMVLAIVALALGFWLESGKDADTERPGATPDMDVARLDPAAADDETRKPEEREAPPTSEEPRKKTRTREASHSAAGRKEKAPLTKEVKETRGNTGVGQPAAAASASGSSESKGVPTNQGQSGKGSKKKAKKKAKKSKRKEPDEDVAPERKPEDDSGATAGRGAASGSNKSPSSSAWSSRDQVVSDDEEDLADDEEVDDEFDISEARGGMQPHLRDRRPPVNRDLGIGFGNEKNPDANGRGGASEQKKSRGVASLVLGVPIPDHIKGRPNPGKTKITQERVEPKEEKITPAMADARRAREASPGHLSRLSLLPWMRDLVRSYYLFVRSKQ